MERQNIHQGNLEVPGLTAENLAEALPELPEPAGKTTDYKVSGLSGGPGLMTRPAELYAAGLRPSGQFTAEQMRAYALLAVKAERERCAKICESLAYAQHPVQPGATLMVGKELAIAIRTR